MLYANTDHVSAKYFLFLDVTCHASRIKFSGIRHCTVW